MKMMPFEAVRGHDESLAVESIDNFVTAMVKPIFLNQGTGVQTIAGQGDSPGSKPYKEDKA